MAECKSCHAPIIWTVTRNGKKMPLDAEPSSDGDFVIEGDPESQEAPLATKAPPHYGGEKRTCHFATCPEAKDWRSK